MLPLFRSVRDLQSYPSAYYLATALRAQYLRQDAFSSALQGVVDSPVNFERVLLSLPIPSFEVYSWQSGLLVLFEGTRTPAQLLDQLFGSPQIHLDEWPGSVHFTHAEWQRELHDSVKQVVGQAPANTPIVLAGHSLGGAIALLTAHRLQSEGANVLGVFSIGEPAVGDSDFVAGLNLRHLRVRNFRDPVPFLPPASWIRFADPQRVLTWTGVGGYVHHGRRWILLPNGRMIVVTAEEEFGKTIDHNWAAVVMEGERDWNENHAAREYARRLRTRLGHIWSGHTFNHPVVGGIDVVNWAINQGDRITWSTPGLNDNAPFEPIPLPA